MLEFLRKQINVLLEERAALAKDRDAVLTAPEAEERGLSEEEQTRFDEKRAAIAAKDAEIEEKRGRIAELEEDAKREERAAELHAQYGQTGEQRERPTV